jgi:hypothetical protein
VLLTLFKVLNSPPFPLSCKRGVHPEGLTLKGIKGVSLLHRQNLHPTYPLNPFSRQRRDQDESVESVDRSLYGEPVEPSTRLQKDYNSDGDRDRASVYGRGDLSEVSEPRSDLKIQNSDTILVEMVKRLL